MCICVGVGAGEWGGVLMRACLSVCVRALVSMCLYLSVCACMCVPVCVSACVGLSVYAFLSVWRIMFWFVDEHASVPFWGVEKSGGLDRTDCV